MSHVLFHPSLGRFIEADELGSAASGNDSDYRRREVGDRPSRREEGLQGAPGSRRHRRFLNASMSESEIDTDGEYDSDEDRPIVRFEWKQHFVSAGTDFFDRNADHVRAERAEHTRRRRLPKLPRRQRGECATVEAGTPPDVEDSEFGVLVESKHALARRMRAAKFGNLGAVTAVPAGDASTSNGESSAAEHSDSSASSSSSSSASTVSLVATATVAMGLQRVSIAEAVQKRTAGQEHAGTLFLQVEHSVRKHLRKLAPTASEMVFLAEFESLLIAYKQGTFKDCHEIHSTFDLLPYDVQREQQDVDTEVTSDDDELMLVHDGKKTTRRFAKGEEPLHFSFRNAYERFLAHGLIQFHQLVGESYNNETDVRITEVRIPKAGVLLHSAKLVPFLIRQSAKKRQQ